MRLDAVFKTVEAEAEGATGVLRFSMASSAFVCACCTVTGQVACLIAWLAMEKSRLSFFGNHPPLATNVVIHC